MSCEAFTTAFDALRDERIEVIQFPVAVRRIRIASSRRPGYGKTLIARGVASDVVSRTDLSPSDKAKRIRAATQMLLAKPELSSVLIGTTKLDHLRDVATTIGASAQLEFAKS